MDWNCSDIRLQAAAYFANQLDASECKALESHLSSCRACRLELSETLSGYRIATLALGSSRSTDGLSEPRLDALHRAAAGQPFEASRSRGAEVSRRMGWFVAAASLALGLTSWMGHVADPPAAGTPAQVTAADVSDSGVLNLEEESTPSHGDPVSDGAPSPNPQRSADRTAPLDAESLPERIFVAYDPAYGLGHTVAGASPRWGWEKFPPVNGGSVKF